MKKSSLVTRLIAIAFFSSLVIIGCKKENSTTLTPAQEEEAATASSESETESELVFNDVFDNVMGVNTEVGVGGTGVFGRVSSTGREMNTDSLSGCTHVTITRLHAPDPFPVKIIIDFGNGCLGNDGHMRYGKIITVYTGRLVNPGKSATTTFDGFKIDEISVQGTHTITNTSGSTAGNNQLQYTVDVTDARLSRPNGNYSEWNSHRVITQVEGNGTLLPFDDVFTITGAAHGRVKRGDHLYAWQSEITEPLRKRFACHWISKGIIRVRRETLSANSPWVAVLNYGNGDCDYFASLTINGITTQIELPH
jgi:hypothetical protein